MDKKLDDLFKPFLEKDLDINNFEVGRRGDPSVDLILTEYSLYFDKRKPTNVCKGQWRNILRSVYNAWVLEQKGKEHPAKAERLPVIKKNNNNKTKKKGKRK